jgi:hypothetical protein
MTRCGRAATKYKVLTSGKKKVVGKRDVVKGGKKEEKWSYADLPIFKNGPNMKKAVDTGVRNINFTPYKKPTSTCPRLTCARLTGDELKRQWSQLSRLAKLMATLVSTLFNVTFIVYEFFTMPDRSQMFLLISPVKLWLLVNSPMSS